MGMTTKAQADIRRKLKVLHHGKEIGNVSKTCRHALPVNGILSPEPNTFHFSYKGKGT